jgi:phasin family protein
MTQTVETFVKAAEQALAFGRGNVEAMLRSGQILAAGTQDLSKQMLSLTQARFEAGIAGFKALTGTKSFGEAVKLQSKLARSAVEKTVAETLSLTEASLKLVEQSTAPITARVSEAAETVRPAA